MVRYPVFIALVCLGFGLSCSAESVSIKEKLCARLKEVDRIVYETPDKERIRENVLVHSLDFVSSDAGKLFCDSLEFDNESFGLGCYCASQNHLIFYQGGDEVLRIMVIASEIFSWERNTISLTDDSSLEIGGWFAELGSDSWLESKGQIDRMRSARLERSDTFYGMFPIEIRDNLLLDEKYEDSWSVEQEMLYLAKMDDLKYGSFVDYWDSKEIAVFNLCKALGVVDGTWSMQNDFYRTTERILSRMGRGNVDWYTVLKDCRGDSAAMLGLAMVYFYAIPDGRLNSPYCDESVGLELAEYYFLNSDSRDANSYYILNCLKVLDSEQVDTLLLSLLKRWLSDGERPVGRERGAIVTRLALFLAERGSAGAESLIQLHLDSETNAQERLRLELALGILGNDISLRRDHFSSMHYDIESALRELLEVRPKIEYFDRFVEFLPEWEERPRAYDLDGIFRTWEAFTGKVFLEEEQTQLEPGQADEIARWWGENRERFL